MHFILINGIILMSVDTMVNSTNLNVVVGDIVVWNMHKARNQSYRSNKENRL